MASGPANGRTGEAGNNADAIRLARALIEDRFLALGRTLEDAADRLDRLTRTFRAVTAELDGDALKRAAHDLTEAARRVTGLSRSYRSEREALGRLAAAAAEMDDRVARMHRVVKDADVLGVGAKIEAMHIGAAGADFVSFAEEIDRSLKLAQSNLAELAQEIAGVRSHLDRAEAAERGFEAQHASALDLVPGRLAAGVTRLAGHHEQAAGATAAVAERSQRVGQRVGEAVMALQIGDITRQRIEHVEQALALLEAARPASQPAGCLDGDGALDLAEWRRTAARIYRLLSAQLADTAGEFDQEVERVLVSLRELAGSAADIAELGRRASGSTVGGSTVGGGTVGGGSADREDSFLRALQDDVARASALLAGFASARANADQVVSSVEGAAANLSAHVGRIRSLEADIRIMGLNTTLKCGRLGTIGRPLAVIAQELRACANLTAVEAEAVMTGLGRMTGGIAALSGGERARRSADITAVADVMTEAVGRLDETGRNLAGALATLESDGAAVGTLLGDTVARIAVREEIGTVLRQTASALEAASAACGFVPGTPTAAESALLARIQASYTMKQERAVHARITGAPQPADPLPPAAEAEAALDDFLF